MVRKSLVPARRKLDLDIYGTQPLAEKVEPTQKKSDINYPKLLERYHLQEKELRSLSNPSSRQKVTEVLKPSEIDFFLGFVLATKNFKGYLGQFITDLIANSYDLGYRRFHLDL